MGKSGWLAWIGLAVGVGAAMAVALDDVAVGTAIGAAVATVMTRFNRAGNCPVGSRPKE